MLRDLAHRARHRCSPAPVPTPGPSIDEVALRIEIATLRALVLAWHDHSVQLAAQSDTMRQLRRDTEAALGLPRGPR